MGRFNSRSRVGSDASRRIFRGRSACFNSRSRVGSDLTNLPPNPLNRSFNSRSRVGSDLYRQATVLSGLRFNSRSRVGSDVVHGFADAAPGVSIRAPAWGATSATSASANCSAFQFALPRGERRGKPTAAAFILRFNSRSRVGSDFMRRFFARCQCVSIRAPAWGATPLLLRRRAALIVSIRAPAWGATGGLKRMHFGGGVSIRAPAWGATFAVLAFATPENSFNSRSRVGSDGRGERQQHGRCRFNSRSRVGSDEAAPRVNR